MNDPNTPPITPMINDVVKEYNTLAIAMPDEAWSKRFAHSRMEARGTRIYMEYQRWAGSDLGLQPEKGYVTIADAEQEIERLKQREGRYRRKQRALTEGT